MADFKRGDKARLVHKRGGAPEVGEIGVVTRASGSSVLIDFPSQGDYSVSSSDIELIVDKPVVEPKAKITKKVALPKAVKLEKHDILGQDKIHKQLELAAELDIPTLIIGETGSGKTTIVKSIADKHQQEYVRFNLTGETTVDEFVGKYVLRDKETIWEDGVLLSSMKQGKWLIVDEVNVALPEILFVLHSLLDDDKSVMVANHSGEIVRPHKDFRFFGTMNPVDEYAGTKELNKAFKSRFGMILNMEYPTAKTETQIVAAKGNVDIGVAMQIVDVGQGLRKAKSEGEVFYTCSTRDLIQWATLVGRLNIQDAFTVSILNKANGDGKKVKEIYQKVITGYEEAEKDGNILNIDELVALNAQIQAEKDRFTKSKRAVEKKVKGDLLKQLLDKSDDKDMQALKALVDESA